MSLILKRAPIGWNQDDYDVVEDGVIVGRIFFLDAVATRGAAMASFVKLLLDQTEQQAKLRESSKKDEAAN